MKRIALLAVVVAAVGLSSDAQENKNPVVVIDTSLGAIKVELYSDKAPITVKNFLGYVDDKFYDDTLFHRVIGKENSDDKKDFMIQGGGFEKGMKEKKAKAPIKNEAANGLSNLRGTLAMAREKDPDTAASEFFINVDSNKFLDADKDKKVAGYAVFGKVIDGMAVVDKIKAVKTHSKGDYDNVPVEDVVIKSVRRAK